MIHKFPGEIRRRWSGFAAAVQIAGETAPRVVHNRDLEEENALGGLSAHS